MDAEVRVLYNRPDCPYYCGEPLPPKLRWQGPPCPRCGRPLYPFSEVVNDAGEVLWPPPVVPRPSEAGLPGVTVWYVVRKDEGEKGVEIAEAEAQRRSDRSENESCSLILIALVVSVAVVVAAVACFVFLAPR